MESHTVDALQFLEVFLLLKVCKCARHISFDLVLDGATAELSHMVALRSLWNRQEVWHFALGRWRLEDAPLDCDLPMILHLGLDEEIVERRCNLELVLDGARVKFFAVAIGNAQAPQIFERVKCAVDLKRLARCCGRATKEEAALLRLLRLLFERSRSVAGVVPVFRKFGHNFKLPHVEAERRDIRANGRTFLGGVAACALTIYSFVQSSS